ncbi:type II toxin-antitoxin system RelE family toxin [Saccharibacillus brassicae]|uniref:Type II toxin-antitoxin system RelE/ParE family toxin n=1 Tax=Saccharibacillus brassicae TaxID=2583377 RepID=A0A4Y6UV80_SACBS|nr:type II toxin-antitoxin system RelE/ParE family toxin [Saccharibacillus brassicae]QDH21623.1 type II toxin-antitoxin system RelE/ParE family toxin [Saccharibacillus brassicae]
MMYTVRFSDAALKKLKKIDRYQAALLIGWIEKNLVNCSDPRSLGKALVANHRGKWRYRIGDYRILALIEDEEIIITIIDIGHRRDIYG